MSAWCSQRICTPTAEKSRTEFVVAHFKEKPGGEHVTVRRSNLYEDAIQLYSSRPEVANEVPICVHFEGEAGMDFGGVSRDFFSGFWEAAYVTMFDGAALLTPAVHACVDINRFLILGRILSHGYLCCGFLPTRVCFPVLALALLGLGTVLSRETLVGDFLDFVSDVDKTTLKLAMKTKTKEFSGDMQSSLVNVLSRFGCRELPTRDNLRGLLHTLAKHQFQVVPCAALALMSGGVPSSQKPFWQNVKVEELRSVYDSMTADPEKVLKHIQEPCFANANEERVFGYLQQYVGLMKAEEVKRFLRYVTGSSVLTGASITVSFNGLDGLSRRPVSHTCTNLLELPSTYATFTEFVKEFAFLMNHKDSEMVMEIGAA